MKLLVLSIKTEFLDRIRQGKKKYEYRKSRFRLPCGFALVYSSREEKKVTGILFFGNILKGSPRQLWNETQSDSGLTESEFFKYFGDRSIAYAIEITGYVEIGALAKNHATLRPPPQSFYYVLLDKRMELEPFKSEIYSVLKGHNAILTA